MLNEIFFSKKVKDSVVDMYRERFDFYKKIMDDKIFPQFVDYLYRSVREHHRNNPQ